MEIEIKFFLDNPPDIRRRIEALGAKSSGRVFEKNIRFEDSGRRLIQKKSLLRLRQDKITTLTYKSSAGTADSQFKIHKELEVTIDDFHAMVGILEALGYHQEQIYEKYRETFKAEGTTLCLDTLPFGDFLEIEGSRKSIPRMVQHIGLPMEKRILKNYLTLFSEIRKNLELPFSDITFNNFSGIQLDRNICRQVFENAAAGDHRRGSNGKD